MLPDPLDGLSEKPSFDLDAHVPVESCPPAETEFPGRSMGRFTRRTYAFVWNGPTGPVAVTVRDFADYFGGHHWLEIELSPGTLFRFPARDLMAARAQRGQPPRPGRRRLKLDVPRR